MILELFNPLINFIFKPWHRSSETYLKTGFAFQIELNDPSKRVNNRTLMKARHHLHK